MVKSLLVEQPLYFHPQPNLLTSPFRIVHPLEKTLILVAGNFIWEAFLRKGVPESSIPISLASLRAGILKQYNKPLKLWWQFYTDSGLSVFNASISEVLSFLTKELQEVGSYGTLNSYRSTLSLIMSYDLGNDVRMKRFFKVVSVLKPQKPKYKFTWDPLPVLTFLKSWYPNDKLNLEQLSQKLVML